MFRIDDDHRRRVEALCKEYAVLRLELTGSGARADFDESRSDLDLLVEFAPDATVSGFRFVSLAEALSEIFSRKVDLIELGAVRNPLLREALARDRVAVYAAA